MKQHIAAVVFAGAVALGVGFAGGAAAEGKGPSVCKDEVPGAFISWVAREIGHSKDNHPGPFVPFVIGCNPTADPFGGQP